MQSLLATSRGSLVAEVLAGSWRHTQPASLNLSGSQLDEVTPLLYGSGAGALGWWRVRETELKTSASAAVLQQAFRLQVLQSGIHEEKITKVLLLLRQAAIEPILVKGWAAAGFYPERGLRPYGDIDLLVRSEQYRAAAEILAQPEAKDCWVDLHQNFDELDDREIDELFERSQLVPLGLDTVRVLSAEDHLSLLAVHLLKHGAWRPLWLCDIAAAVEGLPQSFDWDICLGSVKRRAGWIVGAISLARHFLGAQTDHLPAAVRAGELPRWLTDAVFKEWQNPFAINQPPMRHPVPMAGQLMHPTGLFRALRDRWPNPIIATISVNGQFNGLPRLPYQLWNCALRAARLLAHSHDA
jgi:Uncharacterised nucleotidyltransferase